MACFEVQNRIVQVKKMYYIFIEILFSNVITVKSFCKKSIFFILIFPLDSKRTTSEMFLKVLKDKNLSKSFSISFCCTTGACDISETD